MPVPMLELAPQNAAVKAKVLEGLSGLIDRSAFILGENVKGLEAEISAYAGAQLAALMGLGIGHGDEVIVPSFTFFATAGVVSRLGAKPVFIDLEPATFNATGALVEAAITPRTKATMPVHLFGQLADMPSIMAVAAKHGLPVVEDACQSLGAKGWGKSAGQFGDMTAYSFAGGPGAPHPRAWHGACLHAPRGGHERTNGRVPGPGAACQAAHAGRLA